MTIAYDGTDFCGWQKQSSHEEGAPVDLRMEPEADEGQARAGPPTAPSLGEEGPARVELRTVQGVVERAVRAVVREPVVVMGASRTDSGVHARGQVAAFTCSSESERGIGWPIGRGTEGLVRAINSRLPADVLVMEAAPAPDDFNPIQGATSKEYSYTIWNGPTRPLWERRTALHVWRPLDVRAMDEAARLIEGEHDFGAFAAAGHGRLSTVRTVFSCRVRAEDANRGPGASPGGGTPETSVPVVLGQAIPDARRIVIEVCGSGFLWNMVRIIGGTLCEVGKGRMTTERIREALRTGKRELAGPTLQPQGLCLEWIKYE
jgi:tRNA pseudouridine38-40 synthase